MHTPLALTLSLAEHDPRTTKSLGIQHVTEGLLAALAQSGEVALRVLASSAWVGRQTDFPRVHWQYYDYPTRHRWGRLWWDQVGVGRALRGRPEEWLLLTKGFAPLGFAPRRLAVYVHDAMHDYYRRHYPGALPPGENLYFRAGLRAAFRQARILFTNSRFTAAEMTRLADSEARPDRPRIVYAGIGFNPPPAPTGAPQNRTDLLIYANPLPHKLTALAVRYLAQWQEKSAFAGTVHWVGNWPAGLPAPDQPGWIRHGRISDEQHARLLGQARASIFFSAYEGFGMPPVEAVFQGAAPVFSDIDATREVMGSCGFAFQNEAFESFRAALDQALRTPPGPVDRWRDELLARHNWTAVGQRICAALREAEA